jgi:predicted AlkP superfamily pyrophosphatase or phosphodiesterase
MKSIAVWFSLLFAIAAASEPASPSVPPLILISLDGFRSDYTEIYPEESAPLRALKREGVAAQSLIPVFPSNTFPNHYSIVTGLYPAHHGMVNNEFFDPASGVLFRFNQPNMVENARWWGGEPIWATAVKQGRKAATAFWVGSEAEIAGVRPTFWQKFDYSIPFEKRLDELIGWLTLPLHERPAVVAFYLEEINGAGHRYGPNSAQVAAAIKLTCDRVATLLARVRTKDIEPNLLIVSDHGMAATSAERVVILEDHIERASVQIDAEGSGLAVRPVNGDVTALLGALQRIPHAKAYRAEELPAHFHFAGNARIAPIWVLPEEGWHVVSRSTFERLKSRYAASGYLQGDHGYDPLLPTMHGILIGHGPAFRRGAEIPPVENIHVYNLMCALLKLQPAKNDGDDRLVKTVLQR